MIRVRCEDFGGGVFMSQFYRRHQSAGRFSNRNRVAAREILGAVDRFLGRHDRRFLLRSPVFWWRLRHHL